LIFHITSNMVCVALSVIIITHNEAHQIAACIESVPFADEWVVLDSGSTDGTQDIARSLGARVVQSADWQGFGVQKNRVLNLASGQWVLSLDADERVSPELAASIQAVVSAPHEPHEPHKPLAYELPRLSRFCGQWMRHGDWYPDRVLRLFQRMQGRFSNDCVHERLVVSGPIGRLSGHLLHDTMPSLEGALDKMNRYTTGRAQDQISAGKRGSLGAALGHGLWAFFRCYVVRTGFLDGRLGFVLAVYVAEGTYYRYLKMALVSQPTISRHTGQ
jgi:glycosyltransferase involved in cell wall biosynthesis